MSKIRQFINDNNISFTEGSRNTSCTIIIGYALHLGLSQTDLEAELQPEIKEDGFIQDELDRLFLYCLSNNYGKFWSSKAAKKQYKF
jgi:hypothetical protein